jgi:hypothetical protein
MIGCLQKIDINIL